MSRFDTLAFQAAKRARGYWLLSRLFLEVPTAARLAELLGVLADERGVPEPGEISTLRAAAAMALNDGDQAALAFTRHLVLGDKARREPLPYEAHVLEGTLPGEATQAVAAAMAAAGFHNVASEAPCPDHLGAELRFMALLCHREQEAWQAGEEEAGQTSLEMQRSFLERHLSRWAPDYCRELANRCANRYLSALSFLAAATIEDDVAALGDICSWIVQRDPAALASLSTTLQ